MESLALSLLDKMLGPYFEGIVAEKLRVGVWSGNVVLSDLALRPNALDGLELADQLRVVGGRFRLRRAKCLLRLLLALLLLSLQILESGSGLRLVRSCFCLNLPLRLLLRFKLHKLGGIAYFIGAVEVRMRWHLVARLDLSEELPK